MKMPTAAASTRLVAAIVLIAVTLSWVTMALLDIEQDDGGLSVAALFGLPMIAAALIVEIVLRATAAPTRGRTPSVPVAIRWWALAVLPLGCASAFAVGAIRDPEYFIGDDGPWMLVWVPIFAYCALLLGLLVWFFVVFPISMIVRSIRAYQRGEVRKITWFGPFLLLAVGVACVVGGLGVSADLPGRFGYGAILAALLGLPGRYEILWEPGLWIARIVFLVVIVSTVVPLIVDKVRGNRDAIDD